jgi:hypothetical protein
VSPSTHRTLSASPAACLRDAFVALAGAQAWATRLAEIARQASSSSRAGQAIRQRHAIELTIERLCCPAGKPAAPAEQRLACLAGEIVALDRQLSPAGRDRLAAALHAGLTGDATLVPVFHLMRTAALQRQRGFTVHFAGLQNDAPFDLLLSRDGAEAELACDTISAEEGRDVQRRAWFRLADRIDPDLRTWLAAHPGRYLLRLTLPFGLRCGQNNRTGEDTLTALHRRIRLMLEQRRRREDDSAVVLRLDPLLRTASQPGELGLVSHLRCEFGPEAHLSVTAGGRGVFAMAARAVRENDVAAAVRRRMASLAPARLTGIRPGILAMFVEDTDRDEWRSLRDRLELEGEARQFLTCPEARPVVAVTCASRFELFGLAARDAVPDGELHFRNPAHPSARVAALAPAVLSSV